MMHDREKSDSVTGAGKPENRAAPAVADPVEPRTGTERTAGGRSSHRTRVSQALARVRQAVLRGHYSR